MHIIYASFEWNKDAGYYNGKGDLYFIAFAVYAYTVYDIRIMCTLVCLNH